MKMTVSLLILIVLLCLSHLRLTDYPPRVLAIAIVGAAFYGAAGYLAALKFSGKRYWPRSLLRLAAVCVLVFVIDLGLSAHGWCGAMPRSEGELAEWIESELNAHLKITRQSADRISFTSDGTFLISQKEGTNELVVSAGDISWNPPSFLWLAKPNLPNPLNVGILRLHVQSSDREGVTVLYSAAWVKKVWGRSVGMAERGTLKLPFTD